MDWPSFCGIYWSVRKVDRVAKDIKHTPQRTWTNRNRNRSARINCSHASLHSIGRGHRNGSDSTLSEVLLNLGDKIDRVLPGPTSDTYCVVNGRQLPAFKFDVDHWADNLNNSANLRICVCHSSYVL